MFAGLALGAFAPGAVPPPMVGSLGPLLFLYGMGVQYGVQFFAGLRGAGQKHNLMKDSSAFDGTMAIAPAKHAAEVRKLFGNSISATAEFSYVSLGMGMGMVLGVLLGLVPIPLPWIGSFSLGLASGLPFVQQVGADGLPMLALGAVTVLVVVALVVILGKVFLRLPFPELLGIAAGATGNPAVPVLANRLAKSDRPNLGYAMIFPSMTIVKIVAVQVLLHSYG